MSAISVVIAENGRGVPVRPVETGAPLMTVAENGLGAPIVLSERGAPFVVEGLAPLALFYVDPAGSDSNDGRSPGTAWQSLAKVNAETIPAGAQVLFKGGETFSGSLVLREGQHFGLPGSPIVYGSYGTGKATIQTTANAQDGVDALNPHDVTIQDLIVIGTGNTVSTSRGVFCRNALLDSSKLPGVRIEGLEVSEFGVDGIVFFGNHDDPNAPTSGFDSPVIDGCVVHHCTGNTVTSSGMGIAIRGVWGMRLHEASVVNPIIQNCIVHDCTGKAGLGNHSGNGIFMGEGVAGGLVQFCLAYNNGANGKGSVGIWMADCTNTVIQFCVTREQKTTPGQSDGGGFDIDGGCQNCTIQYCYAVNCHGPGYLLYQWSGGTTELLPLNNNTIRYCISENNSFLDPTLYGEIIFGTDEARDCSGNMIYGNTIYSDRAGGSAIMPWSGATNRFVNGGLFNNILIAASGKVINSKGSVVPAASFLVQGNLYWTAGAAVSLKWGATTYPSVAAWRAATGNETFGGGDTSINLDPLMTGVLPVGPVDSVTDGALAAYTTQVASPARGNGQDLQTRFGIDPPRDFFGNPVPENGFDAGCFESDTVTMFVRGLPILFATVDVAYTGFAISAVGGQAPYTYSVASGSLPTGVTLNSSTGDVTGTPTVIGTFADIVLQATDANLQTAQMAPFTITVAEAGANELDGIAWTPGPDTTVTVVGNDARAVKSSTNATSPRMAKLVTDFIPGATYRAIGSIRKGTSSGNIFFRVTADVGMLTKDFEVGPSLVDVTIDQTFVPTGASRYVGVVAVCDTQGQYGIIDNDFRVEYVSGP